MESVEDPHLYIKKKMKHLILILTLAANAAIAQTFSSQTINSTIKEVTIYIQSAQVTRHADAMIPKGKSKLTISSLSPFIDAKSVQVKAEGDFTLLAVKHRQNHLGQLKKDERIDSIKIELKAVDHQIGELQSRLEVLQEKSNLLDANKDLGGENAGATIDQIRIAMEFYDQQLTSIKNENLKIRYQISELHDQKSRFEQELINTQNQEKLPIGEIEIVIDAPEKTSGNFKITYIVANAGWIPKYDVRVKNVEKPLELHYKADVYQHTGISWDNVKLKLSNGNPNLSGVAPELQTWYLNYSRFTSQNLSNYNSMFDLAGRVSGIVTNNFDEPLPGVTIMAAESTVGTVSDLNGNFELTLPNGASQLNISSIGFQTQYLPITGSSIHVRLEEDLQQLSEVVVIGYGASPSLSNIRIRGNNSISKVKESKPLITSTIENQTTVEIEVDMPYTIKSNNETITVDLNQYEIDAIYEYYAVPKLDKDAFLIARIINWDTYNLLEGEANLYFEDAYVGRSVLDARSLSDTLNISLGRDKSIVIGRNKIDDYSKRRTIGMNKVDSRGFELIARNKKSQPIKLTIFDQIPLSANSNITVDPTEYSHGNYDEKSGLITWELNLNPQQQTNLKLAYEVKYPKYEKVVLE